MKNRAMTCKIQEYFLLLHSVEWHVFSFQTSSVFYVISLSTNYLKRFFRNMMCNSYFKSVFPIRWWIMPMRHYNRSFIKELRIFLKGVVGLLLLTENMTKDTELAPYWCMIRSTHCHSEKTLEGAIWVLTGALFLYRHWAKQEELTDHLLFLIYGGRKHF